MTLASRAPRYRGAWSGPGPYSRRGKGEAVCCSGSPQRLPSSERRPNLRWRLHRRGLCCVLRTAVPVRANLRCGMHIPSTLHDAGGSQAERATRRARYHHQGKTGVTSVRIRLANCQALLQNNVIPVGQDGFLQIAPSSMLQQAREPQVAARSASPLTAESES